MVIKCAKILRIVQFYRLGHTLRIYTRLSFINCPSLRQLIPDVLDTQIFVSQYNVTHLTRGLIMAYIRPKLVAQLSCTLQLCKTFSETYIVVQFSSLPPIQWESGLSRG